MTYVGEGVASKGSREEAIQNVRDDARAAKSSENAWRSGRRLRGAAAHWISVAARKLP